jgi:peptide/nickel transport system substrate-binding protein
MFLRNKLISTASGTVLIFSMLLAACQPQIVEVVKEVPVDKIKIVEVEAKPDPTAVPEKELVVIQGVDPETLDMQMITAQVVVNIGHHITERLLDYDENIKLKPLLAISWEHIEPKIWQYKLREGVTFSNGEPFNAEQVKFSFDRVMAEDSTSMRKGGATRYVESVEVVDEYTVNFHTPEIVPLFDQWVTMEFPIVPKGYITENGDEAFARHPIGTGPFIFEEWVKDDHITMVRNPDYWGTPAKIDRLTFRSVPDIAARAASFLAGEADVVTDIQPIMVPVVRAREGLSLLAEEGMRIVFVKPNTRIDSPMTDVRVRQALNYGIDKEAIVASVMGGFATVSPGQVVSSQYWGFNPDLEAYPYDPEKAKALLADAGYPNGFDIRMSVPRGRYMNDAEIGQALAGQLEDIGVNVKVETREFSVHNKEFYTQEGGPLFLIGYKAPPDTGIMLSIFESSHPNSQHVDPVYDDMVNDALAETDADLRLEKTNAASEYFREQAIAIFLHQQWLLTGVHDRVQDFHTYPDGRIYFGNIDINGSR